MSARTAQLPQIGLYGGTFDPVHRGHLAIAEQVLSIYDIEQVLFIPAAWPPHKGQPVASFAHRVAMLETALAGMAGMGISLIEAERDEPSYTIHTCRELRKRLGSLNFLLIIGADSLYELHLWYGYQELLAMVDLIVVARPSFSRDMLARRIDSFPGEYVYSGQDRAWLEKNGRRIYYLESVSDPVSSSEIRTRFFQGRSVDDLVPPGVKAYIEQHHLYKSPPLTNI